MSDSYVPEGDALDQRREIVPGSDAVEPPDEEVPATEPAAEWPVAVPVEASEVDVLEQARPVPAEDEDRL